MSEHKKVIEIFRSQDKDEVVTLLKNTERIKVKLGEIKDSHNWTLLHYAAIYGWTDICQILVEQYHVDPHVKSTSVKQWTALHWACRINRIDTVKYLVSHAHCDPLIRDRYGDTPLSVSREETEHFLREIIIKSKEEGFTKVPDYTKALAQERHSVFDEAMAEGGGDLSQCNIVFHGPPGAGKSSVKALILGKPPRPKHMQSSTDIVEKCVRTVSVQRVTATSNQQCFEEVDNDEIITRITAEIEKYRKLKQILKAENSSSMSSTVTSYSTLSTEEGAIGSAESSVGWITSPNVVEKPSRHSTPIETVELIRNNLLHFESSSYKSMFDSCWLHHIDSGGQPQFLDVFPLMYRSPNSHFVFVMRLTDGLDERPKVQFYIEGNDKYCLPDHLVLTNREMIIQMCQAARRISQASGEKFTPHVFVVGTHNDQLWPIIGSIHRRSINSELLLIHEEYKDVLVCKTPREEVMFMINAMAKGEERKKFMEELQRHILLATRKVGDPVKVPLKWLIFHLELDKSEGVVRMKKCMELGCEIGLTEQKVRAALEFLNKAALVLYYPDDVPDLVITKMDPFTNRLSKLIKASFIAPDKGPTKECDVLRKKGVFKKSLLQRVFHDVADNLISDEEFLKLLESLKIAVHIGGDEYFLPSALSLEPPSDGSSFNSSSNPLALLWDKLILPHGFFLTVSVELQDKTGLEEEGYVFELRRDKPQWRGAIQCSEVKGLIPGVVMLTDQQKWIEVAYSGPNTFCPIVYRAVKNATERAVKRLQHTGIDSPRIGSTCPLCKSKDHYCTITKDGQFVNCSNELSKIEPVKANISCWFEGGILREAGQASLTIDCHHKEQSKDSVQVPPSIDEVGGVDDLKDISPLDVFNDHTPEIMGVVSDTDSLIAGLVSEGILPDTTTDGTIGRHERVDTIMKTVRSCMEKSSSNPRDILVKFSVVLMNQDNVTLKRISTDMRSQLILSQSPIPKDVFNVFCSKTSQWEEIGIKLEVRPDYRDQLRMEGVQSSSYSKLERILREWVESMSSEVSWYTILKVLRDLQYYEILKSTRSWLKQEDVLKKYLKY